METIHASFNTAYQSLIEELFNEGEVSTTRKGAKLTELFDKQFTILQPWQCMAACRDMSLEYLADEFNFYLSGSNKLEDAITCSPFWKKCTDDGETINSNYGKLLLHDRNEQGKTQFEHALDCLRNSVGSKKAVMTIYDKENAYISNDNPCTMYLKARIDQNRLLHLTAVMRSSDIYYGLPYDVPFFVFIQYALIDQLKNDYPGLQIGTYTHIANSLHYYEYKEKELKKALSYTGSIDSVIRCEGFFAEIRDDNLAVVDGLVRKDYMEQAWRASLASKCMKKKVGAVMTITVDGIERILETGYGDIADHREACKTCVRDDDNDKWFETQCASVHAEHRCLNNLRLKGINPDFTKVTVYVTHGPCDSCLKMLDFVGVTKVYYDVEYKTDYSHWPSMEIKQLGKGIDR